MRPTSFALLIEPDAEAASAVEAVLRERRAEHARTRDGQQAWEALAARRPDVVLLDLSAPDRDLFLRRLRDEYMGIRPRIVALVQPEQLEPSVARLDLDAVLVKPASAEALTAVAAGKSREVSLDGGRLKEMLKLSVLSGEHQKALDTLAHRLVLVYGMQRCTVLATASERQWVGSSHGPIPEEGWPELWHRCDQAVNAGAPLLAAAPDSPGEIETRFAAPIRSQGGALIGAVCLFGAGPRIFSGEARDALGDLAQRLGTELSWRSVHDRLAEERDRLRENAMYDPLLGILSRAALDQTLTAELGRHNRSGEPLCVAILDIKGLRHINDRYGHLSGDAALKHVADLARRRVRAQDMVARYGGDEIAFILPSTSPPGATSVLERVRRAISSEGFTSADGREIRLEVGIGVTEFDGKEEDIAAMLARAGSSASAAAKQDGGAIAIADKAALGADTQRGLALDRFEAGATLGGMYQIAHEISRGAVGVVYRAEDLGLSRPVAIKMLRPDLIRDKELVQRFRAEAAVLAALNHENLVRVYAFLEEYDDVYFVMELVEGLSLDDVIVDFWEAGSFLESRRVAAIVTQVASALDAMHEAGIMHRDVKPGNVVLDRTRDRAVLVDVGLAKKMGTRTEPAGTPGFVAPESFRGGSETPASDVYGLAATAYTLLTGRAPFGSSDDYREILKRQLDEKPKLPSMYRSDLRPELDRVLLRGLQVDARDRYATAGDFARALEDSASDSSEVFVMPALESSAELARVTGKLDAPASPPSAEKPKHTLALDMSLIPPAQRRDEEALTRGVVFRGVARVLGPRAASSWVRAIARDQPELADALSLRASPLAWLSGELFTAMLDAVSASGRNAGTFARQLAGVVVDQSFRRFYPSSPESLSPAATLSALEVLWRRYHTWGKLEPREVDERTAIVTFHGPGNPAVCAFTEGWLEAIVSMSGTQESRARHPRCSGRGDSSCEFHLEWSRTKRRSQVAETA